MRNKKFIWHFQRDIFFAIGSIRNSYSNLIKFSPMPYNQATAERIKTYLKSIPLIKFEEKKMFGGLAFMVNGKMCINASGDNLMCRFDPLLQEKIEKKKGYLPMIMKGKKIAGYCYVEPDGFKVKKDFEFWMNLCLDYNDEAKASKK